MRGLTLRATRVAVIAAWMSATVAPSALAQAVLVEQASPVAEAARIVLVGGPAPLWPRIIDEYGRRYASTNVVWETGTSRSGQADLVFAYYPTPEQLRTVLSLPARRRLGFPTDFVSAVWKQPVDHDESARASAYLDEGGLENGVRLLAYLVSLVRPGAAAAAPPVAGPQAGIYHPDAGDVFPDFDAYREWWTATRPTRASADGRMSIVAVSFFGTSFRGHDLAAVDTLIRRLEAQGLLPVAVFGYPLDRITPLLQSRGVFQPDVAVALNATLSAAKDAEIYQRWGVPVLNGLVTRESAAEWRDNPKGIPADRVAAHLSVPERAGLIAPTLVATTETGTNVKTTEPFAAGIAALVERVERILALRRTPNHDKRVALIYYNNPAGKGNIGASYLQVFPSLRNVLAGLAGDGYAVPEPLPDEGQLRRLLEANGRNVELWAQGETQRMGEVAGPASGVMRWPVTAYRRYYDALPREFRAAVEGVWGPPERSQLMTVDCPQGRCLLLPAVQQGHVLLAPQPLRTTFDQASDPSHEKVTPPPHQYIAFYLWLQHEWRADALVHVGRHGTLEWLPGKQTALAPEDAVSVLLGGVPNFNIYVMDGGGEAIQAKRRGLATLVSHLTPMIWRAGGRADLETLHQSFHTLMDRGDELSPDLAMEHERITRAEVVRLGLDRQLKLDMQGDVSAMAPALHRFLHDIENAPVPAGLPVFGQSPREDQIREAAGAYLFAAFPPSLHDDVEPLVPTWSDAFLAGEAVAVEGMDPQIAAVLTQVQAALPTWIRLLRESGQAEIDGLLSALRGAYSASRLLGDPLRKPEALPTGSNLHAMDAARIPTEAAWRVGQKMAAEFLQRHAAAHDALPKRVSLVLWYGETERQQGAMECMALALLGVRPTWNQQGLLAGLQLVEREELGRDRVDVVFTVSGNYRDGFPDKVELLDRAVRLAAQASDGIIAARDRDVATALERQGVDPEDAARQSQLRVFSAKPGAYGVGVQYLVEKSDGGDSAGGIAALYTANMGFGYSRERWGEASQAALTVHLRSIDAVQLSRTSNLYGSLDNDDTYQYVGGLRTAIAQSGGHVPDVYLHDLRRTGEEKMVSLREWLAVELHSRQFNPTWLQEMQKSGYAGAREMSKEIEHLYGFQKTAPEHLDSRTWQTVLDVFVKDTHGLGLRRFFDEQNPHARQTVLARLLEVDRQGIQRFSADDRHMLLAEYARSITLDGAACSAQICGNTVLRRHVAQELRRTGQLSAAATMDDAFRRTLTRRAPNAAVRTMSPPVDRVVEWRASTQHATAWTRLFRVPLTHVFIPWWAWAAFGLGQLAAATLFVRRGRSSTTEPITLR